MALKGIRVIEFAGLAPAPFCGMILADFGATVLRIDKVGSNTELDCLGNGKQSIALNLKNPKSIEIVKSLCKVSDVLLEPFRKGVMEKLNLGPDILLKENPRLIYARLTGYGQSGAYSERAGHDINYLSLTGLLSLFGRSDDKPIFPVNLAADFGGGGLTCAFGIVLALLERMKSGRGQVIDSNMVQGTGYLGSWLYRSQNLPIWGKERGKNFLDSGAHFYEVYETKDNKYMAVGALEIQFYNNLLVGLGLNEDDAPHLESFEKNKELFTKIFKTKTQKEWCDVFENVDACVTPVLSLEEAYSNKHNRDRESFVKTKYNEIIPKPAPLLSHTPGESSGLRRAPNCGENTRDVLRMLNYSDDSINEMERDGIVECYNVSKL